MDFPDPGAPLSTTRLRDGRLMVTATPFTPVQLQDPLQVFLSFLRFLNKEKRPLSGPLAYECFSIDIWISEAEFHSLVTG